jgi:hypothetical protein
MRKLFLRIIFVAAVLGTGCQGEHVGGNATQRSAEPAGDKVGSSAVRCREALLATGLVDADDNVLLPGHPESGFEFEGCVYSAAGVFHIDVDLTDAAFAPPDCLARFPHTRQVFRWVYRWSADRSRFGRGGRALREVTPAEKIEGIAECPVTRVARNPQALSPYLGTGEGMCMRSLLMYFDRLANSFRGNLGDARRLVDGSWAGREVSTAEKARARSVIERNGLPFAEGIADERETKLLARLDACAGAPSSAWIGLFEMGGAPTDKASLVLPESGGLLARRPRR